MACRPSLCPVGLPSVLSQLVFSPLTCPSFLFLAADTRISSFSGFGSPSDRWNLQSYPSAPWRPSKLQLAFSCELVWRPKKGDGGWEGALLKAREGFAQKGSPALGSCPNSPPPAGARVIHFPLSVCPSVPAVSTNENKRSAQAQGLALSAGPGAEEGNGGGSYSPSGCWVKVKEREGASSESGGQAGRQAGPGARARAAETCRAAIARCLGGELELGVGRTPRGRDL